MLEKTLVSLFSSWSTHLNLHIEMSLLFHEVVFVFLCLCLEFHYGVSFLCVCISFLYSPVFLPHSFPAHHTYYFSSRNLLRLHNCWRISGNRSKKGWVNVNTIKSKKALMTRKSMENSFSDSTFHRGWHQEFPVSKDLSPNPCLLLWHYYF